jgi:hypothetical protein
MNSIAHNSSCSSLPTVGCLRGAMISKIVIIQEARP